MSSIFLSRDWYLSGIWPYMPGSVYLSRDWYQAKHVPDISFQGLVSGLVSSGADTGQHVVLLVQTVTSVHLIRDWYQVVPVLALVLILVSIMYYWAKHVLSILSISFQGLDWYLDQVVQRCRTSGGVPPLYISSLLYLLPFPLCPCANLLATFWQPHASLYLQSLLLLATLRKNLL